MSSADLSDFFLVWLKGGLPAPRLLADTFDPTNPRRPVFIWDFRALERRQKILDDDAVAGGEDLESNLLSQDFAMVSSSYCVIQPFLVTPSGP